MLSPPVPPTHLTTAALAVTAPDRTRRGRAVPSQRPPIPSHTHAARVCGRVPSHLSAVALHMRATLLCRGVRSQPLRSPLRTQVTTHRAPIFHSSSRRAPSCGKIDASPCGQSCASVLPVHTCAAPHRLHRLSPQPKNILFQYFRCIIHSVHRPEQYDDLFSCYHHHRLSYPALSGGTAWNSQSSRATS